MNDIYMMAAEQLYLHNKPFQSHVNQFFFWYRIEKKTA